MRTDIAGFVGFAERGPLPEDFDPTMFDGSQAAVKIGSWKEFLANFGGFREYGYLAYAVRAFFENGGKTCYAVRVAATTAADPLRQPARAFFTLPSGPAAKIGTLGLVVNPFQCAFTLAAGAQAPKAGDLIGIAGGGMTQGNHVVSVLPGGRVILANSLNPQVTAGATISLYPAACTISATSRGNWGNDLRIAITPLDSGTLDSGTFALRVTVDPGPNALPTEDEFYRALTLSDPTSNNYAPAVLQQQSNLVRLNAPPGARSLDITTLGNAVFYLQGGRDGLSAVTLRDFSGGPSDLRGLRLLEQIDDVAILAIPDAVFHVPAVLPAPQAPIDDCLPTPTPAPNVVASDPTAVATPLSTQDSVQLQLMMIDQCQRLLYRVALIDPPDGLQVGQAQNWPNDHGMIITPSSRFAAFYYPWLLAPDSLEIDGPVRAVPPSGYVAGAYAQADLKYGVQRPPANVELQFVVDVEQDISDLQQEGLNLNNVNAIRSLPGRGIRVWGARSLASLLDEEWRFIHVRRLMSAIEETVQRSSRWAVFQNNNDALRNSLKHSLTVLLEGIWAKGGLKGTKPADAFYVKCDTTNNPQPVIDNGQLICEVGIAIAAPMEFLVFEIRQDASGAQILEN